MLPPLEFFIAIVLISALSGILGSLTGLGGATFLVPIYTLYLGIPIVYASGASLISTIATSSGAASAYIKDRITNVRIGMGLEIATTTGSIAGALTVAYIYSHHLQFIVYIVFGIVLLSQVYVQLTRSRFELPKPIKPDWTTKIFQLYGKYYDAALNQEVEYYGIRWWLGEIIMFFAGYISGLLGIGSGALKVLGMDWAMNLPMKVSTTTSNFMIGVTAATGSSIYWLFGYIEPFLAAGTAIGVLIGAYIGTKILVRITNKTIRYIFTAILVFLGIQMIMRGLGYGF
ncbi:permease [Sulfolobus sp. A20]|uniref:sulfite exporter TauE/SafE family protein n=1 Tax=Saccharolobus sp. A20 TaxID=1891280 RepID=UPI00084600AF|nr:sulfite exporter TauE/SafE family protein [Sulfolobus sp. A20]TRM74235.1 sulfite exporter TauE/SafE family protein [Sulfolobus sp. B5]TRM77372.1 sulfite exporter TauE/SafE family protein [Sulfolobus sp. A20-N-F8]TRM80991.1 sulfite exporter TauE/SafE family protein [Sulfolobus sp. D5]TRM83334.1 sulfite exporter TauE/SafE family protein [Sulfolobus sp. F3]TRM87642.1 sulfite exporter TauE/SafE family protein [Sulfolobus sp. E3]TRM89780.1 sulfite exporter TauE/SafE family protein [Sulfolobus s